MGRFLKLFVLIGTLWAIDVVTFGGRYRAAVFEEGNYAGQTVQYEILDWFKGIGI